jgi:hypothetical protein
VRRLDTVLALFLGSHLRSSLVSSNELAPDETPDAPHSDRAASVAAEDSWLTQVADVRTSLVSEHPSDFVERSCGTAFHSVVLWYDYVHTSVKIKPVEKKGRMGKAESVLQRLGLPPEFGVALLVFCFALSVAPYLTGADFGAVKIPSLELSIRRRLRWLGPLALIISILLHLPAISGQKSPAGNQTGVSAVETADPIETTTVRSDKKKLATPKLLPVKKTYRVTLLLPTSMSGATVLVDGHETPILNSAATVITIEVSATPGSHEIQLRKLGGRTCARVIFIDRDITTNLCDS